MIGGVNVYPDNNHMTVTYAQDAGALPLQAMADEGVDLRERRSEGRGRRSRRSWPRRGPTAGGRGRRCGRAGSSFASPRRPRLSISHCGPTYEPGSPYVAAHSVGFAPAAEDWKITGMKYGAVLRMIGLAPIPSGEPTRLVAETPGVRGGRDQLRAGCLGAAVQLEGEEQVGQLAVAVGLLRLVRRLRVALEHRLVTAVVGDRGDRDHAGRLGLEQRRQQQAGEREVAEVVGAELELVALRGLAVLRRGHHAGVVDQQVERAVEPVDERVDRGLRGEVELLDGGDALDLLGRPRARRRCCGRRAPPRRRGRPARQRCGSRCRSWRRSRPPWSRSGRAGPWA